MRGTVSRRWPRALAVCDRCGARYNHDELQWQFQWQGPKLQNLRILVCQGCLDIPQEQLRTIILPPDPVPIQNPRPEQYVSDMNPNSPVGQAPIVGIPGSSGASAGNNIGTLTLGGGTYLAFMGSSRKTAMFSAYLPVSGSSFANWVGKRWGIIRYPGLPDEILGDLDSTGNTTTPLVALGFEATAPSDMPFLASGATAWAFQGSSDAGGTWTTLASGTTAGTVGETISASNLGGAAYGIHRLAIAGNGVSAVAVAYLAIDTNRGYTAL